ncbi:MAG: transposase [Actinomycetota bacterium]|nr:transposase [Actinomycetota bacterium]
MTTSGPAELERPRVRDASRLGFESALLGRGVARTHALGALVIGSFLRGLSVRDVEAALEECFGERVIGQSPVARVCQDTRNALRALVSPRPLRARLVHLYLDAIYLKLRPTDEPAEGVLVARGDHTEGSQGAARPGAREPRELRLVAGLRARPDGARDCARCSARAWTAAAG